MEWVQCNDKLPPPQQYVWGWDGQRVVRGIPFVINEEQGLVILAVDNDSWVYICHWMKEEPPKIVGPRDHISPYDEEPIYENSFYEVPILKETLTQQDPTPAHSEKKKDKDKKKKDKDKKGKKK